MIYIVKDMGIKNRTYCFCDNIINTKHFDADNIKIDEKLYKNILNYYIGYVTIKKDLKTHNVNPLYIILGKMNEYFK